MKTAEGIVTLLVKNRISDRIVHYFGRRGTIKALDANEIRQDETERLVGLLVLIKGPKLLVKFLGCITKIRGKNTVEWFIPVKDGQFGEATRL